MSLCFEFFFFLFGSQAYREELERKVEHLKQENARRKKELEVGSSKTTCICHKGLCFFFVFVLLVIFDLYFWVMVICRPVLQQLLDSYPSRTTIADPQVLSFEDSYEE